MRIAFDFDAVVRNRFSGFYSFGTGLLEGFENLKEKPEFLLFHSRRFSEQAQLIKKRLGDWAELKSTAIKMRWLEKLWRYSNYPKLEYLTGDFDIYNSFHHLMPPTKSKPRILTVHDLRRYILPDLYYKSKLGLFESAVKRADHFIAVSESTKNDFCNIFNISSDKVDVVHLACGTNISGLSAKDKEQIKAKLSETMGRSLGSYLITFSSPDNRKNLNRVIRAFQLCCGKLAKDQMLVIVGKLPKRDDEIIQSIKLAENKDIVYVGTVTNLRDWLVCADALVFASLYEGFGIPILEAFACGVPVITSNRSSMPEVAGQAAVYVDPYSTESMSEAIIQVCNNAELRNKLIDAGTQRCKEFSWEKSAAQTFEVYKKLL